MRLLRWNSTIKIIAFLIVAAIIAIASLYVIQTGIDDKKKLNLTAWIADWDYETGMQDFKSLKGNLSELQVFAAYFNYNDNLYFTEKFKSFDRALTDIKQEGNSPRLYLTIVNDRYDENGKCVQKDSSLLSRIMISGETRQRHIDEIITAVRNGGFDGLEIDYEKVSAEIWSNYIMFCKELYTATSEVGIPLRIVLEPGIDLDRPPLPEGPQYVIMAYNLYGYHSGPGPKADFQFIRKMVSKLAGIPGDNNCLAFATGGFDWSDKGKVTALTEKQAVEIAKEQKGKIVRNKSSGAIYFEYIDENNTGHTVCYADQDTLEQWIKLSKKLGCNNIALWRLGGCSQQMLNKLIRNGM